MKSNIPKKTVASHKGIQKSATKNSGVLLSIGMIVKNEEKYLERCLTALSPIMGTGEVEIVIIDTGSTDNTVEIARRFTDKVYFFEWIDDFAAARNYGFKKCVGEWYIFIDADEIFDESVTELLKFVKSPESKKYNSASVHIRNYLDSSYTDYNEFMPGRMTRMLDSVEFFGKIHESLPTVPPSKSIPAYIYHYGYADDELIKEKADRNLKQLMRDYEQDPKEPRTLMYMYNTSTKSGDEKRYLEEWIDVVESSDEDKLDKICYSTAMQYYSKHGTTAQVIEFAEKLLALPNVEGLLASVEAYLKLADSYYDLNEYEKAVTAYEKYFDKIRAYQNDELDCSNHGLVSGIQDYDVASRKLVYALCLLKLKRSGEAINAVRSTDFSVLKEVHLKAATSTYVELLKALAKDELSDSDIREIMKAFVKLFGVEHPDELAFFAAHAFWELREETKVLKFLSQILADNYFGMMLEIILGSDSKNYPLMVQSFIDNLPEYNLGFSPIVWEAVKNKCNVQAILGTADRAKINELTSLLKTFAPEYAECVQEFALAYEVSTIKELYFVISLLERVISEDDDACYIYSMLMGNYVTNIYTEDILNDKDILVLSNRERLGYYMYMADKSHVESKDAEYVHYLRLALSVCPEMKKTVQKLTEEIKLNAKTGGAL